MTPWFVIRRSCQSSDIHRLALWVMDSVVAKVILHRLVRLLHEIICT
jgi:hypothetical protein